MPGKELTNPCGDCKDAESLVTVRARQLCRYVGDSSALNDH